MGNILGVPLFYAVKRTLRNEDGIGAGVKEVIAYRELERIARNKRLDLYDPIFSEDFEKMGLFLPQLEEDLEHQRPIPAYDSRARDGILFCGFNSKTENIAVNVTRNGEGLASSWLHLTLDNGKIYTLAVPKMHRTPKTSSDTFAAGGLRLRCLLPMRKWRLAFNGLLLEEDITSKATNIVYVKFSFIWSASSDIFDLKSDIPSSIMAKYLSSQKWNAYRPDIKKNLENLDSYVQGGNISGTIQVEDGDEVVKHFWGTRKRTYDNCESGMVGPQMECFAYMTFSRNYSNDLDGKFKVTESRLPEEGEMLYFANSTLSQETPRTLQFGYLVKANSMGAPIESISMKSSEDLVTSIDFDSDTFTWSASFEQADFKQTVQNFQSKQKLHFCPVTLNDQKGRGMVVYTISSSYSEDLSGHSEKMFLPLLEKVPERIPLVVSLKHPYCRQSDITGGKGSSLADLHLISGMDKTFTVPNGVVVTTAAYQMFIEKCNFAGPLERLQIAAGKLQPEDFRRECESVSSKLALCDLPSEIKEALKKELIRVLERNFESVKVAVRSSAAGEDSEEMSAAGQMKTFLGVQGIEQIYDAVVKCWASQFDYIACQYKRQNGQLLNSPMAVVVQQIVDPDVAGVMFTCDPVTGNPTRITITANYGIGESVVSATAEPDTISLRKSPEGQVQIESVTLGRKSVMTVLTDSGVTDESVSEKAASVCSLSSEVAMKLANIGVLIEEVYGCLIDIEWAVKDDKLFLLQARPVTTFDKETNFEILHEGDGSSRTEKEWTSVANVGEVFPGATSNLGLSTVNKFCFQFMILRTFGRRNKNMVPHSPYYPRGMGYFANHFTFNVFDSFLRYYYGKHTIFTCSQHIATFGRILEDEELLRRAVYRNRFYKPVFSIFILYHMIKDMVTAGSNLKYYSQRTKGLKIDLSHVGSTEEMLYSLILEWIKLEKEFAVHMQCSFFSSMTNVTLFSLLVSANQGEWNQTVYNDVGYVLSSCYEVESVQVPLDIERLAKSIRQDYGPGYETLESREALMWLERTDRDCGTKFKDFLSKNGHRCVKEFDIYVKPWGSDPLPLIKIVQDMVGQLDKCSQKKQLSTEETIKNLKTPLSWIDKLKMKFAVPICRTGVSYREGSKSLMVGLINCMRGAYRQMAERMVLEGRLPSADLFYFLDQYEVPRLLKTRSPKLVQKLVRRKNLFPEMEKMILPEMMEGFPVPINFDEKIELPEGSLCVKGVPVSQGVATGKARVATSLKEAAGIQRGSEDNVPGYWLQKGLLVLSAVNIEADYLHNCSQAGKGDIISTRALPGEILIAYSTDIGWSPYFPMLAGVATELGGLISHGAVVAREYGLPCVVSVQGVTRQFKTGDMIQIDGSKGTITRIDDVNNKT